MLKLLKKFALIILLIAAVVGISLWQPWKYLFDLALIGNNSALTVNSAGGKSEVYLDDKKIGETPLSLDNLSPGDFTIDIKRVTSQDSFYTTISKEIHIEPNTRTLVEVEIGPSDQFSSTSVIYYRDNNSSNSSMYLNSNPSNGTITVDGTEYDGSPVVIEDIEGGEHTISVEADGYEPLEISVISRDGYTLIAEFDLMVKPIVIE
ncbi:MAG: PEGA domain-containing protein [bacterium]